MIEMSIPGRDVLQLRSLLLDFNGTLACDGSLLPGVSARLVHLRAHLAIEVMTADTFGTAQRALARTGIPCAIIRNGRDKAARVAALDANSVVAIGNGKNDAGMLESAALAIAVIGPEGLAGCVLKVADVIVPSIAAALDLLLMPERLVATLRD